MTGLLFTVAIKAGQASASAAETAARTQPPAGLTMVAGATAGPWTAAAAVPNPPAAVPAAGTPPPVMTAATAAAAAAIACAVAGRLTGDCTSCRPSLESESVSAVDTAGDGAGLLLHRTRDRGPCKHKWNGVTQQA